MEISMETICDWLEGRLDADETALVNSRIEQDRELAAQVERLRRLFEYNLPQFQVADPPPGMRARLEALFDQRESESGALDQYRTELVSDSRDGRPPPGMRGGESGREARRLLLFSCQLFDISIILEWHPEYGKTELKGKILATPGLDPGLCSVEIADESGKIDMCEADDEGEFRFPTLSDGEYRFTIEGPGFEVSTPPFEVY